MVGKVRQQLRLGGLFILRLAICNLQLAMIPLFSACADPEPVGLAAAAVDPEAPVVVFDMEGDPLPEIPLPNDLATRIDPDEPHTGRRLNVSLDAPTLVERDVRRKAVMNNGFGVYMPITVRFTRPLDLADLVKRHRDNVDFADDAVWVIDVTKGSETFGQPVMLDLGSGNFPLVLPEFDKYFQNDPRAMSSNLLFETEEEDANGNGRLDPGEDTDHDGVLDHPNVFPDGGDPVDDLLTFYERETDTLILRPVVPLRQETTYAVVLTRRLKGENGRPVVSPFPYVHHALQEEALEPLESILAGKEWGAGLEDVAFAWTFTTQSVTRELEALRDGINGKGPFGWLAEAYPPDHLVLRKVRGPGGQPAFAVRLAGLADVLAPLAMAVTEDAAAADAMMKDIKQIDHAVAGVFRAPFLLEDKDGIATPAYPADDDESFEIDTKTGDAVVGERFVPFVCTIPKKAKSCATGKLPACTVKRSCTKGSCTEEKTCRCQPFPVVVYLHGYGGLRFEALAFAGRQAAFGLAVCALDAHGHGMDLTGLSITLGEPGNEKKILVADLLVPFLDVLDLPGLVGVLADHRSRDLNNDGTPDPAADFWTYDVFHTRDVVRQTVLDHVQFLRILRGFDGASVLPYDTDGDGAPDLAGDFDGDGIPDLGGPDVKYFTWGQSMGGIVSPILAAVEPAIEGVAPVAGGGGLFDLSMRSTNPGVPEAVYIPVLGPFVIGEPAGGGKTMLSFLVQDMEDNFPIQLKLPFHETALHPGDRVVLRNMVNGEEDEAVVDAEGNFRLAVPADALVASEKHFVLGMDEACSNCPVETLRTDLLGDRLEVRVHQGPTGMLAERVLQFGRDAVFQGVVYEAGAPLVSPVTGFGLKRGTPKLRRFLQFASMFIEPADPVAYAPHLLLDPLVPAGGTEGKTGMAKPGAHVLFVPTAGDMNVPVNTGLAMARAAGAIELFEPSPDRCVTAKMCKATGPNGKANPYCRYGVGTCLTDNQVLVGGHVYEGLSRLRRFGVEPWKDPRDVLLDVDDLDEGKLPWYSCEPGEGGTVCGDGPDAPDLGDLGWLPLRATAPDGGSWGMRVFFTYVSDRHGFDPPTPQWAVDMNTYFANLIANFFYRISLGKPSTLQDPWILDDPCLADSSCPSFP